MRKHLTLHQNILPGDIRIHSDILSVLSSAISPMRAGKVGKETQTPMNDPKGAGECILCDPERRPTGSNPANDVIKGKVADFLNDYPYLPADQRVLFRWHEDINFRQQHLHRFKLEDLIKADLFWLLKACIQRGHEYLAFPNNLLRQSLYPMGMVVGFNFGRLAGQSVPHFHAQSGWEVIIEPRGFLKTELRLHIEELKLEGLVLFENEDIYVIAPWTPMGQFALDIHFTDKYNISQMTEDDVKVFAAFGHAIIKAYIGLGIENVNIVFTNSPHSKETEPLVAHFIPRVNIAALYEMKGVNVVDTPPSTIADKFRTLINWPAIYDKAKAYNPDEEST